MVVKVKVEKSRVEVLREQKKKIAEQIKAALVAESAKKRKLENHDKILLGVMFQGLIAEGAISTQMFEGAMDKYLTRDKDKERCKVLVHQYQSKSNQIDPPVTKSTRKKQQEQEEIAKPVLDKSSTVRPPVEQLERVEEVHEFKPVIKTNDPKLAIFE